MLFFSGLKCQTKGGKCLFNVRTCHKSGPSPKKCSHWSELEIDLAKQPGGDDKLQENVNNILTSEDKKWQIAESIQKNACDYAKANQTSDDKEKTAKILRLTCSASPADVFKQFNMTKKALLEKEKSLNLAEENKKEQEEGLSTEAQVAIVLGSIVAGVAITKGLNWYTARDFNRKKEEASKKSEERYEEYKIDEEKKLEGKIKKVKAMKKYKNELEYMTLLKKKIYLGGEKLYLQKKEIEGLRPYEEKRIVDAREENQKSLEKINEEIKKLKTNNTQLKSPKWIEYENNMIEGMKHLFTKQASNNSAYVRRLFAEAYYHSNGYDYDVASKDFWRKINSGSNWSINKYIENKGNWLDINKHPFIDGNPKIKTYYNNVKELEELHRRVEHEKILNHERFIVNPDQSKWYKRKVNEFKKDKKRNFFDSNYGDSFSSKWEGYNKQDEYIRGNDITKALHGTFLTAAVITSGSVIAALALTSCKKGEFHCVLSEIAGDTQRLVELFKKEEDYVF